MANRTSKAINNAMVTGLVTFFLTPIQFINRFFLIKYLGIEFLGLTSLYSNIISVLSLSDLGIGTAIVYLLYKPLANRDWKQISVLMGLYRRIYFYISGVMLFLGLCVLPFLSTILGKSSNYPKAGVIYVVYVVGAASSYLFAYNQSFLAADQKNNVVSIVNLIVNYVMLFFQIIVLIYFKSTVMYAIMFVFTGLIANIFIHLYVKKTYKNLSFSNDEISQNVKKELYNNVVGNVFLRISGVLVTGTDNILLSMFSGIVQVGLYTNYVTITNFIQKIIVQVVGAVSGSIGNFVVTKNRKNGELLFHRMQYINFLMINIATIGIYFLSQDVITMWVGKKYVLDSVNITLITISFFLMNYRIVGWTFVAIYGLSKHMKIFSVNEVIVNLFASVFFLKFFHLGLTGVLLGTIFSTISTVMWQDPFVIFKYAFSNSMIIYFKKYIKNIIIVLLEVGIITVIILVGHVNRLNTYLNFCVVLVIVLLITSVVPVVFYLKTDELYFLKNLCKRILRRNSYDS